MRDFHKIYQTSCIQETFCEKIMLPVISNTGNQLPVYRNFAVYRNFYTGKII